MSHRRTNTLRHSCIQFDTNSWIRAHDHACPISITHVTLTLWVTNCTQIYESPNLYRWGRWGWLMCVTSTRYITNSMWHQVNTSRTLYRGESVRRLMCVWHQLDKTRTWCDINSIHHKLYVWGGQSDDSRVCDINSRYHELDVTSTRYITNSI